MEFAIRRASQNDVSAIWDLGKNVTSFETAEDIVTFWPKSILENCIDKRDVLILVAEKENEIIGFFIVNINLSLKKAELENMYVIEEYKHKGIGQALLQKALEEVTQMGVENVCAMASDAVDFLQRNGFTKGNQFHWMDLALADRFKK